MNKILLLLGLLINFLAFSIFSIKGQFQSNQNQFNANNNFLKNWQDSKNNPQSILQHFNPTNNIRKQQKDATVSNEPKKSNKNRNESSVLLTSKFVLNANKNNTTSRLANPKSNAGKNVRNQNAIKRLKKNKPEKPSLSNERKKHQNSVIKKNNDAAILRKNKFDILHKTQRVNPNDKNKKVFAPKRDNRSWKRNKIETFADASKSSETTPEKACPNGQFWNLRQLKCVPKKSLMQRCRASNDCNTDVNLDCIDNVCVCKDNFEWSTVTETCTSLSDVQAPESPCSANEYLNNKDKKCYKKKSIASTCSSTIECAESDSLECKNRKCSCINGTVWANFKKACISSLKHVTYENQWQTYKTQVIGKNYTANEDQMRKDLFLKTFEFINSHNSNSSVLRNSVQGGAKTGFKMELNFFADMTEEEKKKFRGFNKRKFLESKAKKLSKSSKAAVLNATTVLLNSSRLNGRDWRKEGAVTPVKNQQKCGSCWAFSAVAALETQWYLKTKSLLTFSEQQLIDCVAQSDGCDGGWQDWGFNYITSVGGINRDDRYKYTSGRSMIAGKCSFDRNNKFANVKSVEYISEGDEFGLTRAVNDIGTICVAVDSSKPSFQFYSSGIYDDPECSKDVDHAVNVVGYGTENGQDFYIVRNSWGPKWGENGYMRIARNQNSLCGIADYAMYPVLA